MGVAGAKFTSAGQTSTHYVPGVYSRRNTISAGSGVSSGNLCVIGSAQNGEPLKLLCVSDVAEAKEALGGGQLLDGVALAFNGSRTYVPQQVYCMRVDKATPSTLTLKKDGTDVITLKSAVFGAQANQLRLRYTDNAGERKVSVTYKNNTIEAENIGRKSIAVSCIDADAVSATIVVSSTGIVLSANDATGTINKAALTITAADCGTLSELSSMINDSGEWTAQVLDVRPSATVADLDHGTYTGDSALTLTSDVASLLDVLKSIPLIQSAAITEGASRMMPDTMANYERFTGGTEEAADGDRWQAALDVLAGEDIQIIATPSDDETVRTLIANHCIEMSKVEKKHERTFWTGVPTGTSVDDAAKITKALNTELGSLVMTGATTTNPITGKVENISPALLSCMCAGMEAAMTVSNPLTNKAINVTAFSQKYKTSELNTMIKAGIVPFGENDEGQLVCIRAMTTYQDDNLILNERSMMRSVLYMDRDLRKAYARRIGTNAAPNESEILGVLNAKAKTWLNEDLITANGTDLVFNTKVSFDGDKTYLSFDRYVRAPNNFMFITATNRVYSSTLEI